MDRGCSDFAGSADFAISSTSSLAPPVGRAESGCAARRRTAENRGKGRADGTFINAGRTDGGRLSDPCAGFAPAAGAEVAPIVDGVPFVIRFRGSVRGAPPRRSMTRPMCWCSAGCARRSRTRNSWAARRSSRSISSPMPRPRHWIGAGKCRNCRRGRDMERSARGPHSACSCRRPCALVWQRPGDGDAG